MSEPLYLDYMSTTPLDPEVLEKMLPYMREMQWCANPSSVHHVMGQAAFKVVEEYRTLLADLLGANVDELIFTSGATEANNLAIQGAARFYKRQGKHLITVLSEHKSVLSVFESLEKEGFDVTYLQPQSDGLIDLEALKKEIRSDTILLSVMHVNNEIGVIQDIQKIAEFAKSKGILMHVDAAQSIGRVVVDLKKTPVDLMTFSAHKAYGPKGIGALFVRRKPRVNLMPLYFGGHQEKGLRPGTLSVALIVGMVFAFQKAIRIQEQEKQRFFDYRYQLEQSLKVISGIQINGSLKHRIAENLNFTIQGVDGSDLMAGLYPLIVSSQSACTTDSDSVSHVLKAIGVSDDLARATVRLSFGRFTKDKDIAFACAHLQKIIPQLRKMS